MSGADWLGDCAQRYLNRIAVIDAASGRRHTFRSFDKRANQIAHFCEQWVGLLPGDCIGLLSTPSDDVLQIVVAAGKLGLTALLLDPAASPETLIAAINEHSPRTLFHGLAQAGLVQEIWFDVNSVEHLIPLRGAVDTANFEDIVAYYSPVCPSMEWKVDVPWVCFASEGINWPGLEVVTASDLPEDGPHTVAAPLHRPDGLAAAMKALRSGQCVVVEGDSVGVIEAPDDLGPTEDSGSASQRNMPTGRSWLPHEFL
jgi:acyl-CoA synthetase (AMP-forming)/AMP-acid ligase II